MTSTQDPRDAGRHLLGPHVVGQRVVVRRLVRGELGPTGGPAMTDVLGVCLRWSDGTCVVQRESGDTVTIPISDIVSGKPVPPRPSVRHRVPVRDAELRTASLWASVETVPLGPREGWVLRTDTAPVGRLRRRANSCLAVGDPGLPLAEALARVRAFYEQRGRPAWLQVEAGSATDAEALAAGWVPTDPPGDAELRLVSLSRARRRLPPVRTAGDTRVEVATDGPRAVATVIDAGAPCARGEAAVDGDWLGLHGVEVDAGRRRQGLATAVVGRLLEWGAERGASTAWVHVETGNDAGRAFWHRLGFEHHHTVRYLQPG